ncbi:MAG: hypothetical protein ABJL99_10155 [Aliishimia sp.]
MAIIELTDRLDYLSAHQNFWLDGSSTGVQGLDGRQEVIFTENRVWNGQIDLVPMLGGDKMAARTIGTRLRGRANRLRVPVDNRGTIRAIGSEADFLKSIGASDGDIANGYSAFADGAQFADGSGYALPEFGEPVLGQALGQGDSLTIFDGFVGRNIVVGARFSIDDFLYEVTANTFGRVEFSPPARASAAKGRLVNVSRPTILTRLKEDSGWRPFERNARITEDMSVELVEAFDR